MCLCSCHDATGFFAGQLLHGCFNCANFHEFKPKVTAQNIHTVVSHIESTPDPYLNAMQFTVLFPPPLPQAGGYTTTSYDTTKYAVLVSNEALAFGDLSTKEILAKHINSDLHAGKLPAYLFDLLKSAAPLQLKASLQHAPLEFANDPIQTTPAPFPPTPSGQTVVNTLRSYIPGVDTVVKCPATVAWSCTPCSVANMVCKHGQNEPHRACTREHPIHGMVQHLNDSAHRWSREQIADWLEALDVDLSFQDEPVCSTPGVSVLPVAPPHGWATVNELMEEVYSPLIQKQKADFAYWAKMLQPQPQPHKIVISQSTYAQLKFTVANALKGEWLDDTAPKVETDPLALKSIKNAQPPSYGKFLHNPTKSKKTKEH